MHNAPQELLKQCRKQNDYQYVFQCVTNFALLATLLQIFQPIQQFLHL